MATMPNGPVVVGVDGSEAGQPAVGWAARFAAERSRTLRVVYVQPVSAIPVYAVPGFVPTTEIEWRPAADRIVADAVERARAAGGGGLDITRHVAEGNPAGVLIDEADHAGLLVVGSRGLGGFAGLVIGSVGVQVAAHATSPVVVVPPEPAPAGAEAPVVVGVDGSELSVRAVGFAFEEASFRGVGLVAVSAWSIPAGMDLGPTRFDADEFAAEQDRALAETLAGHQELHPDVAVRREVRAGYPGQVLLEAARGARLVVVGSRGRGGFAGMLLGSVSQHLLHHADLPVAIIKDR